MKKLTLKSHLAIIVGKLIFLLTRVLKIGGGTAAPGLYALKIDGHLLEKFTAQLQKGSIVITGTNGKTTTSRIISRYFSQSNIPTIHNRAGSNLERGLVSTCLQQCSWLGNLENIHYGIWEMDEAEFARSITKVNPKIIVMLNLFRDQLDRYGEVDTTRRKWESALKNISDSVTCVINNDDPQLVQLASQLNKESIIRYNLKGETPGVSNIFNPVGMVLCPNCHTRVTFQTQTISGQGIFTCSECGLSNNTSDVQLTIETSGAEQTSGSLRFNNQATPFGTSITGLYNLYNYIAAFSVINQLTNDSGKFIESARTISVAFGRMEKVTYQDKTLLICLIKNPTGATEIFKTVFHKALHERCGFLLNDNFADGKDVSWIWDIPIESLHVNPERVFVSGTRAYDMALRLQHSGIPENSITVDTDITSFIESITNDAETGKIIPIFTTYTAMIELQRFFGKTGVKKEYWEE